ncbi:MAG: RHS repeat-associated core domain-containing protein [Sulfuricaulis sp.]
MSIGILPGQYFDSETGLYYNGARYYDPRIGRYISSDPTGLDGGLNTYGYAYQNPLRYTDPSGLTPNPAEPTCVDPLQPVCWGGVAADILTSECG